MNFQRHIDTYQNTINKALDYIARNLQGLEDQYALALCAYALHLANHAQKDAAFRVLEGFAKTKGILSTYFIYILLKYLTFKICDQIMQNGGLNLFPRTTNATLGIRFPILWMLK